MIKKENVYRIGRLGKTHGVNGEISFQFDDDIFDRVDGEYLILEIDGILVPFFMEEYRFKSDEVALVKFEDINTQNRASELTGCEVYFPREAADSDDENLSFAQIVGYVIEDEKSGHSLGKIVSVEDSTDNILFCLDTDLLIPMVEEWIKEIDNKNNKIIMTLPEGLININE